MYKIKIPKEILGNNSMIYYLYHKKKIVYIGQTGEGLARVFFHFGKKEFDEVGIQPFFQGENARIDFENWLITKYKPKYNMTTYGPSKQKLGLIFNLFRRAGFEIPNITKKIKDMTEIQVKEYLHEITDLPMHVLDDIFSEKVSGIKHLATFVGNK